MYYKTFLTRNLYGTLKPAHVIIETFVDDSPRLKVAITLRQREVDLHVQTVPLDRHTATIRRGYAYRQGAASSMQCARRGAG